MVTLKCPLQKPVTYTIDCYHHSEPSHSLSSTNDCQQDNAQKTHDCINNNIGLTVDLTVCLYIRLTALTVRRKKPNASANGTGGYQHVTR